MYLQRCCFHSFWAKSVIMSGFHITCSVTKSCRRQSPTGNDYMETCSRFIGVQSASDRTWITRVERCSTFTIVASVLRCVSNHMEKCRRLSQANFLTMQMAPNGRNYDNDVHFMKNIKEISWQIIKVTQIFIKGRIVTSSNITNVIRSEQRIHTKRKIIMFEISHDI